MDAAQIVKLFTGGDKPRPYEKTGGVSVGAAFMAARGGMAVYSAIAFSSPKRKRAKASTVEKKKSH